MSDNISKTFLDEMRELEEKRVREFRIKERERKERREDQIKAIALNTLQMCQEEGFSHGELQKVLDCMDRYAKKSILNFQK